MVSIVGNVENFLQKKYLLFRDFVVGLDKFAVHVATCTGDANLLSTSNHR